MIGFIAIILALVALGILAVATILPARDSAAQRIAAREHDELVAYRRLVADIRDIAYRQMAVDPTLATIIVDEINTTTKELPQ